MTQFEANAGQSGLAAYGGQYLFTSAGQDWITSWHSPDAPPPNGKPHGSSGICVTRGGFVVLISENGDDWLFPAGRPEGSEGWRETLDREMWEEACAKVEGGALLGYNRGQCVRGPEQGLVLVRAFWRVEVALAPWHPEFEIPFRATVRPDLVFGLIENSYPRPILRRLLLDALKIETTSDSW